MCYRRVLTECQDGLLLVGWAFTTHNIRSAHAEVSRGATRMVRQRQAANKGAGRPRDVFARLLRMVWKATKLVTDFMPMAYFLLRLIFTTQPQETAHG